MKLIRRKSLLATAASLALLPLPAMAGVAPAERTLPPLPPEEEAYCMVKCADLADRPQALFLMERFVNEYPASLHADEVRLMMADTYFYDKEYPLALRYYGELRDDAFSGDVREGMLYSKAFSLMKVGYYSESRPLFRRLVSSKKYGDAAQFYLAYLDYVDEKYDDAYKAFKEIRKKGYRESEADYYINQIDYLKGDYRKVAAMSETLLGGSIPPEMEAETLRVGGLSRFKLGDYDKAREMLSRYVDLTGDGAEISALYSLATIYYDRGDYTRALQLFGPVTEYSGDLAQSAWLYIGQIHMRQGDPQAAAMAFDKAARESWNGEVAEAAAYNLAVSQSAGQSLPFSDAARAMEEFIDSHPGSPYTESLSSYLTNAYYTRRDYENALRQIEKVSRPTAETKAIRQKIEYQLGITRFQQGKLSEAVSLLREASSPKAPDRQVAAQASLWLGEALFAKKDYKEAAKAYSEACASGALGDNTALGYYNLGYAYLRLKDYPKAEAAFARAVSLKGLTQGQLADARLRYADCLYYNGRYNEALALFRDIRLDGGQDAVFASVREADILGRNGQVAEKISILERLYEADDNGVWRGMVVSRLADAYNENGQDRKAAELYALLLDISEEGTDTSDTYHSLAAKAENLYLSGDTEGANAAYRRMLGSSGESVYARAVLGMARTSTDPAEVAEYAAAAASLPGVAAEDINEALYLGAKASLSLGPSQQADGIETLRKLADSSDRLWGARAGVLLGETLLGLGDTTGAEETLTSLIDNGADENYWLARAYIALADVYEAQDKAYLAKLYLETLRDNYPENDKEIPAMINSRLKKLKSQ